MMKILAVDTSTAFGTVAILEGGALVVEKVIHTQQTHNRTLLGLIDKILEEVGITIKDIDCFASGIGPGSFTGIRIGLTTIKTLAWTLGKPVYGASSLDILAFPFSYARGLLCPMIDARKREVYYAFYESLGRGEIKRIGPYSVGPPERVVEEISSKSLESVICCGDGWEMYKSFFMERLPSKVVEPPAIFSVVRASFLGYMAYREKAFMKPRELLPLYVRPSEAELKYGQNIKPL